jgi:hypothetical protein
LEAAHRTSIVKGEVAAFLAGPELYRVASRAYTYIGQIANGGRAVELKAGPLVELEMLLSTIAKAGGVRLGALNQRIAHLKILLAELR